MLLFAVAEPPSRCSHPASRATPFNSITPSHHRQALSKRIHFGKFVAEAKFRESRAQFEPLIRAQDAEGILQALTFPVQARRAAFALGRASGGRFPFAWLDKVAGRAFPLTPPGACRLIPLPSPQEAAVADRVARKTALFAESISEGGAPCRVTPEAVKRLWIEQIMPMTKVVQVSERSARVCSCPWPMIGKF